MLNVEAPNWSWMDPTIYALNPFKNHHGLTARFAPTLTEAAGAIIDTRCSKSNPPEPWNWNIYLFPLWCLRVVVRYEILFPIRVLVLTIGWITFLSCYIPVHFLLKGHHKFRKKLEHSIW
ncbi:uncharacterized protein [Solanum tuberosum]|uniref:uncharacterized protein n=1 Tax=Solanum tuberosum TaxID=4113 RepID=UPI0003D2853E|nr:PREDICTED: uncharacterized protein LOC102604036 [Solanum tuberosum]